MIPDKANRQLLLLREASIILAIVFGVYLYVSLGSYDSNDLDGEPTTVISNIGGLLGAYLADFCFYVFGRSAYLAVAIMICCIWLLLGKSFSKNQVKYWAIGPISGLLLLLVSTSSLEALRFAGGELLPDGRSGGILGFAIANSLYHILGFHGTTLILLGCWFSGLSLFANFSWLEACDLAGDLIERLSRFSKPIIKMIFKLFFTKITPNKKPVAATAPLISPEPGETKPARSVMGLLEGKPKKSAPIAAVANAEPKFKRSDKAPTEVVPPPSTLQPKRSGKVQMPTDNLLSPAVSNARKLSDAELQEMAALIRSKLEEFGVQATVREILPGPVITRYEIEPASGVKGSQITGLVRDLSRALGVTSIRVLESIQGKTTMGLEVPNEQREMVSLQDVITSKEFKNAPSDLSLALGKDIAGIPVIADLEKMPHLLVAGTTGAGKSVQINSMILSLLYKSTPEQTRLILVDPKIVEMGVYEGLPHLLAPVITNTDLVQIALNWCVTEMERRYRLMAGIGVRNITGLNVAIAAGAVDPDTEEPLEPMPRLVIIIDELADLMMVAGKKVEQLISRLAQKARAAGVHMILATQRPSVDVITGLIKANVPSRIAFQVSSKVDSRTIIDQSGAEALLGQGDMLYLAGGTADPTRVHGAFVSDDDVHKVVTHIKQEYAEADYPQINFSTPTFNPEAAGNNSNENDPLYQQAIEVVMSNKRASISLVQRHLRIGYNRSARLIEQMERNGLITSMDESGSRKIIANHG